MVFRRCNAANTLNIGRLMKRKALLIGNTNGLQGVQLDIERTAAFLQSPCGGTWYPGELEYFRNPDRSALLARVDELRRQSLDYVFLLFSGHGGHQRQTFLELNAKEERVQESLLQDIAPRQLNIYDCCRVVQEMAKKSVALDSLSASFREAVSYSRQIYESRIMQAIPQQIQLYACAVGQYSYDTANGAIYLNHLLNAARSTNGDFKTVGNAHEEARIATTHDKPGQVPEASLPKCLTSQQLIISMKA
jgi:hypothetical protein